NVGELAWSYHVGFVVEEQQSELSEKITLAPATGADRFASRTAAWLFIRDAEHLTSTQRGMWNESASGAKPLERQLN
ncbi:MAG TPA: hypothetical protein VGF67_18125, partial [Ktedonobacteraceae bacterium]